MRGREGEGARQVPAEAWTIGHSTRALGEFVAALEAQGIERVADVRRFPASRRHPQFDREALAAELEAYGIAYRWFEELGGRRRPEPDSPNRGLETEGFRGYADYMRTPAFARAFNELTAWMREGSTAILCAERLWWQCHRRLLSDLLVAQGGIVRHVQDAGRVDEHRLWELAVATDDGLVYPPPQTELGFENGSATESSS
jgi:uncharacterized protein (DUF488 family)